MNQSTRSHKRCRASNYHSDSVAACEFLFAEAAAADAPSGGRASHTLDTSSLSPAASAAADVCSTTDAAYTALIVKTELLRKRFSSRGDSGVITDNTALTESLAPLTSRPSSAAAPDLVAAHEATSSLSHIVATEGSPSPSAVEPVADIWSRRGEYMEEKRCAVTRELYQFFTLLHVFTH